MNGPAEIWQQAADCFEATMANVSDEQWDGASGCGEWTVRELVDHAIFWQANVAPSPTRPCSKAPSRAAR